MANDKRLFLLDGMALVYRAHFAFATSPRITSSGLDTSAVFGFTNTLLDLLKREQPTHIAVVFDTEAPTARHIEYEKYKAQRPEMPEGLKIGIPYVKQLVEAFRIPVISADGFEADDIIGTLAWKAAAEGHEVFMMTPDKDFAQLVAPKVFIYKPGRQGSDIEIMGVPEVLAKWEIDNPSQVIDVLGLWGDASDNIPGVPSFGEKTAKKLVKQFGSMEGIYDNLAALSPKQRQTLEENREQAFLSKRLATIDIHVPVEFDEKAFNLDEPDKETLRELFKVLEFRTLAKRVLNEDPAIGPAHQTDLFGNAVAKEAVDAAAANVSVLRTFDPAKQHYELADSIEKQEQLVALLLAQTEICFDTETTGTDANLAELVGLSFSWQENTGWYVPVPADASMAKEIVDRFRPVLESQTIAKIGQNLKYDHLIMLWQGVELGGTLHDTMLQHYLLEPEGKHGMDALSAIHLGYAPIKIETLIGKKGKGQGTMRDVPIDRVSNYAAEDADVTLQLHKTFTPILHREGLDKLYTDVEMPLVPVLSHMEREGVKIDTVALKEISLQLEKLQAELETQVYEAAGMRFNIGSPKQLGEVLYDVLKLDPKAKRTRTGQYATDETTLQGLASVHAAPQLVLDYRKAQKLKSTYVDALPLLINPKTGRVHTTFNQAVAATGRLSSTNPNLQNIPIRTEMGKEIRKAFVARDDDHILVSCDYSQIELRIITAIAGEERMAEAFNAGLDIHTATAAQVYGCALEDVTSDLRRMAKTVNFGIIYGISSFGLAQRLGVPKKEAQQLIDAYFTTYPGIKRYMNEQINKARETGYVETLLGRRRYLRDATSTNPTMRGFAERNAVNAPIQGSAADMIKLAMIAVHKRINKAGLQSRMTLQVHDELIFDCPKHEVEKLKEIVIPCMQNALPLKNVPVVVDAGEGRSWLEAH